MNPDQIDEALLGVVLDGRFRIDSRLGAGGMGTVYQGTQLAVNRSVAIKLLRHASLTHESMRTRFFGEARALAALSHRNIVSVIDFGEATEIDSLFLVMDHVEGVVLSRLIERGPVNWRQALKIAAQIVNGLSEAHHHGIVHRDLKPDNLMLTVAADGTVEPVILDFGLAQDERSGKLTETGNVIGTPEYMAPEQAAEGTITPATDFYGLGVILYEMLSGAVPFRGPSMAVLVDKIGHPAPPLATRAPRHARLPVAVTQFVDQLLLRNPSERPQSGALVSHRLLELLGDSDTTLAASPRGPDPFVGWYEPETRPMDVMPTPGPPSSPSVSAPLRPPADPPPSLSTREIAIGVVAALATCAIVVGALSALGGDEPAEPPPTPSQTVVPVKSLESGAVAEEPPPTINKPTPDLEPMPEPAARELTGCGKIHDAEYPVTGETRFENEPRRWTARLPRDYDPAVRYPIVLLFHKNAASGEAAINERGMDEFATEKGVVVLAPETPYFRRLLWTSTSSWMEPGVHDYVRQLVIDAADMFCLDRSRIYAVGHGAGGRMVENLACHLPLSAAASSGHRFPLSEPICTHRPTPFIHIWGRDDPYLPRKGTTSCETTPKRTLHEKLVRWREANGCDDVENPGYRTRHGSCKSWDCEAPFSFCEVHGGHLWPGEQKQHAEMQLSPIYRCVDQDRESLFDYRAAIWHFVETDGRVLTDAEQKSWNR